MDVRLIGDAGVVRYPAAELPALLERGQGLVWVDIPICDEEAVRVLSEVFGFHRLAVRDCVERNHVAKGHVYRDHVFVVLHAPERGKGGHVHYLELDQFIGPGYLVTVHGPLNPAVDPELALRETHVVRQRIEEGRLRPSSSFELSYAVVSALTRHQEAFVASLAEEVGVLEQRVMRNDVGDPEHFLEELFRARHGLIAVRTMATLSGEVYGRIATLTRFVPAEGLPLVADLEDQFTRVRGVADGQKEFLHGVIEFYRTRTETKMTIAAERLAVIAVITLPITALSSIYGMNIIVNDRTDFTHLAVVLAVMVAISATLLRWAKRQGWW
jgi:Mg2+ and Co2+ transporter CorA